MSKFKKGSNHSMDMVSIFNILRVLALKLDMTKTRPIYLGLCHRAGENAVLPLIVYFSAYLCSNKHHWGMKQVLIFEDQQTPNFDSNVITCICSHLNPFSFEANRYEAYSNELNWEGHLVEDHYILGSGLMEDIDNYRYNITISLYI